MEEEIDIQKLDEAVNARLSKITNDNRISQIHEQIFFYYNSFNVILGKQGTGKTTFILKEMIKLSNIKSLYTKILYVSNGDGKDLTYAALKGLIKIPMYCLNFEEATNALEQYYSTDNKGEHIIVIIEDGSFLLEKENEQWGQWICKLRHLKTTMFINLHIWRTLNPMLKTQIGCVIVFKGFSKEVFQRIFFFFSSDLPWDNAYYMYITSGEKQALKIDNISSKVNIINV